MLRDLLCLRMMQWSTRVSVFMKVWAWTGVRKDTLMDLGAARVLLDLCWMRWILSISGWASRRFLRKSSQASSRVRGCSVSQKRNRLSGRLSTKMVESSASRGGGRSLRLFLVSLVWKSVWEVTLFISELEWKVKMTRLGSCLGEK